MKEIEIVNNKFAIKVPSGWKDLSYYQFEGPLEDGIKHNIIVTIENDVRISDLVQYANRNIDAIEVGLQGYSELKRGIIVLNNKVQAYELVYKWLPTKDRQIYQRVIYILVGNTGYILTASFSKKTWKTIGSTVDGVLRSFSII